MALKVFLIPTTSLLRAMRIEPSGRMHVVPFGFGEEYRKVETAGSIMIFGNIVRQQKSGHG
jgi:hypothetical protein